MIGVLGAASALGFATLAGAQGYTPSLEASAESDGNIEVCGEGWAPGEQITVSAEDESDEVTADSNGSFCTGLEVACGDVSQNGEGEAEVEVSADGSVSGEVATDVDLDCENGTTPAVVTPTAEATQAAQAGALAFTGSSSTTPLAIVGIALLLIGSVITVILYRRREPHSLGT
jgi:LPXTG-motif cell wall-anchored protein